MKKSPAIEASCYVESYATGPLVKTTGATGGTHGLIARCPLPARAAGARAGERAEDGPLASSCRITTLRCGIRDSSQTDIPLRSHSMNQVAPKYLHSLDVARGIAAFAVVLWHWQHFFYDGDAVSPAFVRGRQPLYSALRAFYDRGDQAVSLFFTLSGFIFFWLYADRISSGAVHLREFFVLRISRLWPLHLATLIFVAGGQLLYWRMTGGAFVYPTNDVPHFVLNALFLASLGGQSGFSFNGPSWSISVEMCLYAIFYLYCTLTRPRLVTMLVMAGIGIGVLGAQKPTLGQAIGSFFLGGTMFATCMLVWRSRIRRVASRSIPVVAVLLWLVTALAPTALGLPDFRLDSEPCVTFILFPLTILALPLAEVEFETGFRRVAELTRLGSLSYSVYMIHFPLQLFAMLVSLRLGVSRVVFYSPWSLLVFFTVLIALSIVSHDRFEIPAQRLFRRRLLTGTDRQTSTPDCP